MEKKVCRTCKNFFHVADHDVLFCEKMQVPPPTQCPECRLQRRLAWRNERTLYFRPCDLTGKKTLSVFAPDAPFKVFGYDAWHSDVWDPMGYGRDFDFNRPFFDQFFELVSKVPLLAVNAMGNQNCDYVNQCGWSKNCYFTIEADYNEDSMYSYRIFYSKTCVDCTEIFRCERCYECVDCDSCYNLRWSQLCKQCSDSAFLFDCRGCGSCFGCVGLRRKNYCLFNEQLTKEEYERRMKLFDFANPEHIKMARAQFEKVKLSVPRKSLIGEMNEEVSGNYIYEGKNVTDSFDVRAARDVRYCHLVRNVRDCMDYFVWGNEAEKIYECQCCGQHIQNLRFCLECWEDVHDLTYCFQCVQGTANCFGCVGLKKKSYCILNKQYAKEEYEKLVPKIIEHMKGTGEWGEFLPAERALYGYNETSAQEYFPLTKEAAVAQGLKWQDKLPFSTGKETLTWNKVPNRIEEVSDSLLNEILACEKTGRNFKITAQELRFYRDMKLPLPRLHPDERHRQRMQLRNPRTLWKRSCEKCNIPIETSYAPERPEKVYCEKCYLEAVY